MRRPALVLAIAALACRVDPIESLSSSEAHGGDVLPAYQHIPEAAPRTPELDRTEAALRKHLGVLAGPHFGGRRPGTEGAEQTVSFMVDELDAAGLVPASHLGGWLQPVPLRVVESKGKVWLGPKSRAPIESGIHVARTLAPGRWRATVELRDAGFGITAPDWGRDDYADLDVSGAAVLVRAGAPEGSPPESVYSTASYKYERALRAGATACLLLTGASESDPAWDQAVARFVAPNIQGRGPDDPVPTAVDVFGIVSLETEGRLRSALDGGAPPRLTFEVDTDVEFIEDPNVIGRITGAEAPEQSVVVLAHWDAGGLSPAAPEGGGVERNATGVAMALAMADELGTWHRENRRPRRSIVFVFTAAGSLGTLGADAYMNDGIPLKSNVAAVIVLDGFALQDRNARLAVVGAERTSLDAQLQASFGSRLVREDAGSELDSASRRAFDGAGLVTVGFTRRSERAPLSDAPFAATSEIYDTAVDTRRLLDFVWRLANDPAAPVRVEPEPPAGAAPAPE